MGSAFLVYFFRFSVIIDFKIHLRTITHPTSAWAVVRNATSRKPERPATGVESASRTRLPCLRLAPYLISQ
jgi:hypothetical protein